MARITVGTNLLDTDDIALIASRGVGSMLYLADSLQVESALSAAAQAAAVNAAAPATLTAAVLSSNFGSCYINGSTVQCVVSDGAGGTNWFLRSGPGTVICPSTDLVAAEALIAAATPTPPASAAFTPVISNSPGLDFALAGPATLTTIGTTVLGTLRVAGNVPGGQGVDFVVGGLPATPNAGIQCSTNARVTIGSDPIPNAGFRITRDSTTAFSVKGSPFILATTLEIDLTFAYTL